MADDNRAVTGRPPIKRAISKQNCSGTALLSLFFL